MRNMKQFASMHWFYPPHIHLSGNASIVSKYLIFMLAKKVDKRNLFQIKNTVTVWPQAELFLSLK